MKISFLVHALDGYDEISLTGDTKIFERSGEFIFSAEELGFKKYRTRNHFWRKYKTGCGRKSSKIFLKETWTEEQNSVVLANAAMALKTTGKFSGYEDCLFLAKESLESGKSPAEF